MPKIKELSKYNGSSWETGVPIGADASNVDVTVSGGSTKSLQTVLGTPSNSTDLQTQINSKVGTTGDGSSTTVTGISNYDTDSGETSKDLVTDVVASNSNSQATLWSKFNRFRRRVGNKFGDYFATANLVTSTTGVTTSGTDSEAYTAKALNDYFANVIGYASESDLPSSANTVASQLSSLNNKTTVSYITISISKHSGDGIKLIKVGPFIIGTFLGDWQNISSGETIVGTISNNKPNFDFRFMESTGIRVVLMMFTTGVIKIYNYDAYQSAVNGNYAIAYTTSSI